MKKLCLFILPTLFFIGQSTWAQEMRITLNDGVDHYNPAISGDKIVWNDIVAGMEIFISTT